MTATAVFRSPFKAPTKRLFSFSKGSVSTAPSFLIVAIFAIIWHWNEYYQSVIFFTNNFPLSVTLSSIRDQALATMGYRDAFAAPYVSAACLMFIAPVLIMYIFLQKKFIQSIDRVGIVG